MPTLSHCLSFSMIQNAFRNLWTSDNRREWRESQDYLPYNAPNSSKAESSSAASIASSTSTASRSEVAIPHPPAIAHRKHGRKPSWLTINTSGMKSATERFIPRKSCESGAEYSAHTSKTLTNYWLGSKPIASPSKTYQGYRNLSRTSIDSGYRSDNSYRLPGSPVSQKSIKHEYQYQALSAINENGSQSNTCDDDRNYPFAYFASLRNRATPTIRRPSDLDVIGQHIEHLNSYTRAFTFVELESLENSAPSRVESICLKDFPKVPEREHVIPNREQSLHYKKVDTSTNNHSSEDLSGLDSLFHEVQLLEAVLKESQHFTKKMQLKLTEGQTSTELTKIA